MKNYHETSFDGISNKKQKIAQVLDNYRKQCIEQIKNGTLTIHTSNPLEGLGIDLTSLQSRELIDNVVFGKDTHIFRTICEIEDQISDILSHKSTKSLDDISQEKRNYIDGLPSELQYTYTALKKDPLFYLLIGGSYDHRPETGSVRECIDVDSLADYLITTQEKLNHIHHIADFLGRWRSAHIQALANKNLASTHESFYDEIEQLGLSHAYTFEQFEYIVDQGIYGGRKLYRKLRNHDNSLSQEDQYLFQNIKKDPIYHLLVGSTGAGGDIIQHVFDDEVIAKILYRLSYLSKNSSEDEEL